MIRFVILAAPRTGSNLLCTLLHSHPEILCHHELFNPNGVFYALPLRDSEFNLGSMAFRDQQPDAFLNKVWSNHLSHKAIGFKMTHRQHLAVFSTICADKNIHKIVLKRQAQLKTYVSRLIAEQSTVWEDYQRCPPSDKTRQVHVDYRQFKESIAYNNQYYQHLEQVIQGPCIEVHYEDLADDQTQQAVLTHLQLPIRRLHASSRQQNKHAVAQLISNASELREQLQQNPNDKSLLNELNQTKISDDYIDHLSMAPPSKLNETLIKGEQQHET